MYMSLSPRTPGSKRVPETGRNVIYLPVALIIIIIIVDNDNVGIIQLPMNVNERSSRCRRESESVQYLTLQNRIVENNIIILSDVIY